ncbi:MAG TPA: hypothetical protein DCM45_06600, partial [Clostridiales bacterium]|nr:hypothetical protein [Clostridiales bacterium]
LSVIIPARNEASNLPFLLESLQKQSRLPDEIIVADDDSTDQTAAIAQSFGVRVLNLRDKPAGWLGKSWACQQGADNARSDLYLFLDADVTLDLKAIARLLAARQATQGVVSVLPWHKVRKPYEYFSLFFNLIQIAGNGSGLPFQTSHAGLFGPAILISRDEYERAGGHCAVRQYVVEDLAFGRVLAAQDIKDSLYYGDGDVSFRMYGGGVRDLARGWMKNVAAGASQTPALLLIMAIFWITGCFGCIFDTVRILARGDLTLLGQAIVLIACFILMLMRAARQAGDFHPLAMLVYPIWLLAFLILFVLSLIYKIFGFKVVWKDRKVDPCK